MDETAQNKLIDDFLLDRLSAQERTNFIARLEEDASLKEAVKIREVMIDQLKTIGNQKLKKRILDIQSKVEAKSKPKGRRRLLSTAVAAAAVLLLLVIAYQWISVPSSNQDLFAQNYQAHELPFGNRSETTDNRITDAGALYQQGKYKEALPLFEKLVDEGVGDDRITLAIGICYLELKEYKKAIAVFKQASTQNEFYYKDQAIWYLALIHLQLDQIGESKILLQSLSKQSNYYMERPKDLLDKLK